MTEKKLHSYKCRHFLRDVPAPEAAVIFLSLPDCQGRRKAILTIIWGCEQIDVIKTFPEWFIRRWKNIKAAAELARTGFFKIHDLLPERWYNGVRYAIPVIIYLCMAVGLFLALRAAISRFKPWYCSIWSKYQDKAEKRLKTAYTASLCIISFLVAVLLAGKTPLHWFSWFLICSIISHLIHHAAGRQHSERR